MCSIIIVHLDASKSNLQKSLFSMVIQHFYAQLLENLFFMQSSLCICLMFSLCGAFDERRSLIHISWTFYSTKCILLPLTNVDAMNGMSMERRKLFLFDCAVQLVLSATSLSHSQNLKGIITTYVYQLNLGPCLLLSPLEQTFMDLISF